MSSLYSLSSKDPIIIIKFAGLKDFEVFKGNTHCLPREFMAPERKA